MTRDEYIKELADIEVITDKVKKIEELYGTKLPDIVKKVISSAEEPVFIDDYRIMSIEEIEDAEADLHINFKDKGIIPIVDCGENDFIVYHFVDIFWSKFNIIDETVFKKADSFEELFR